MKKIISGLLIINFIFLSGCVEKDVQSSKNEKVKDCIVYNIGKLPEDLSMLSNYNIRQQDLLINLFEGLVRIDNKGKINGAIAESWDLSKDETCYTFKIKDSAKWNDGSYITAEDFVGFFQKMLNKDINNIYAYQLYCIFGAEDYKNGKCDFSNVAIKATNRKTLEIRLNYPCNYFLNVLSEPIYSLRKMNTELKNWKKDYKDILYSGYFTISGFSKNNEVILNRNNQYWDRDSVKSNKIYISCNDGSEASLAAFESNKVDVFISPPINELKNLIELGKATEQPSYTVGSLVFNLKGNSIVRNLNFRKAVAASIDRNNITKDILKDSAKPSLSYIPPGVSDGMNGSYINKNFFLQTAEKDKVLELIKNSKYNKNKDILKMIYINTVENKKVCETICKNLSVNLDVKIQCEGYDVEEFNDEIKGDNYDIAKVDYEAMYNYPTAFLESWVSYSKLNFYGYKNTEFDDNLMKVKMEKQGVKKIEFLRLAENLLMEDMPVIPIYFNNIIVCKKNDIQGIYTTKKGNMLLDKAYERK